MNKIKILLSDMMLASASTVMAQGAKNIRLNEVLASCSGRILQDENGNSPDWIELHNSGGEAVSLAGFCLFLHLR